MPRENSLSDTDAHSLTSDEQSDHEDAFVLSPATHRPSSPVTSLPPGLPPTERHLPSRLKSPSRRSVHSNIPTSPVRLSTWATPMSPHTLKTPKERFKGAVRKIMSMRRGMSTLETRRIGAEPGVDPRLPASDAMYGHIHAPCEIEIVDYSSVRSTHRTMGNAEFVDFMDTMSEESPPRDPWVKVRWINIGGMSWDVIKAVSIRYKLHPLALEDVFHGHSRTRSKADYYSRHLFLRVLCHELADTPDILVGSKEHSTQMRTTSPEPMDQKLNLGDDADSTKGSIKPIIRKRVSILPTTNLDIEPSPSTLQARPTDSNLSKLLSKEKEVKKQREARKKQELSLKILKKEGERVDVMVSPMFFFLFRDGTVISIHPTPNLRFTTPISHRLKSRDTVLRKSADASLLLHALLDLIVDRALQVIDQYHKNIDKFETSILLKPKISTVRQLHILSGDLILRKRTLEPIKTLIYGLRRYDTDRCAALIDSADPNNKNVAVVGFMSHKAKIYLADVYDHMEYILTSLEMFAGIAENLINYSFNLASYEMNEVMRRLTLATIIFLPLTILTGYFGMNFGQMWSVNNNSDLFFWELAIPMLIVVIPIFMYSDLARMYHYLQKRTATKKALENYEQETF